MLTNRVRSEVGQVSCKVTLIISSGRSKGKVLFISKIAIADCSAKVALKRLLLLVLQQHCLSQAKSPRSLASRPMPIPSGYGRNVEIIVLTGFPSGLSGS